MEVQVLVNDMADTGAQVLGGSAGRRRGLHAVASENGNGGLASGAGASSSPHHVANLEPGAAAPAEVSVDLQRQPRKAQQGAGAGGVEEVLARLQDRRMGPAGSRHRAKPQAAAQAAGAQKNGTLLQPRRAEGGGQAAVESDASSAHDTAAVQQQPQLGDATSGLGWLRRRRQQRRMQRRMQQEAAAPGANAEGGSSRRAGDGSSNGSAAGGEDNAADRLTVLSWRLLPTTSKPRNYLSSSTTTASRSGGTSGAYQFMYNTNRLRMDDVSTVIFITDMCGNGPAVTVEELEARLFGGSAEPSSEADMSVQGYMSSCSNTQAIFSRDNVLIVGPVSLDCDGSTWDLAWSTLSCFENDYVGWQWAVEEWAYGNDIDISRYRHRVVITSPRKADWMTAGDPDCLWSGMGVLGPAYNAAGEQNTDATAVYSEGVFSYAWVSGDHWNRPQGWLHELGHNYYLHHATSLGCGSAYCDDSCTMGYCCTPRCFNAPHNWQVGWDDPTARLGGWDLPPGLPARYTLASGLGRNAPPPRGRSGAVLRVDAAWAGVDDGGVGTTLWVSYRAGKSVYDQLPDELTDRVSIFWYPGTDPNDATVTVRLAALAEGEVWRNDTLSLSVTRAAPAAGGAGAQVVVCRYSGDAEAECGDGLDDDCDGLVDMDDPDCSGSSGGGGDGGTVVQPSEVPVPVAEPTPTHPPPPDLPPPPESPPPPELPPPPPPPPPSPPPSPPPLLPPSPPKPPSPPPKRKPPKPPSPPAPPDWPAPPSDPLQPPDAPMAPPPGPPPAAPPPDAPNAPPNAPPLAPEWPPLAPVPPSPPPDEAVLPFIPLAPSVYDLAPSRPPPPPASPARPSSPAAPPSLPPPAPYAWPGLCLTVALGDACSTNTAPQPSLLACPANGTSSSTSCYITALNASLLNGTLQPSSLPSCNALTSPSGKYRLVVQDDGSLVLYNLQSSPQSSVSSAPAVQWTSNTSGVPQVPGPVVLKLWLNGTLGLVWYRRDISSANGWRVAAVRSTAPGGGLYGGVFGGGATGAVNGPFSLSVRDDGRAYLQNRVGAVVWATSDPGGPAAFAAIGPPKCTPPPPSPPMPPRPPPSPPGPPPAPPSPPSPPSPAPPAPLAPADSTSSGLLASVPIAAIPITTVTITTVTITTVTITTVTTTTVTITAIAESAVTEPAVTITAIAEPAVAVAIATASSSTLAAASAAVAVAAVAAVTAFAFSGAFSFSGDITVAVVRPCHQYASAATCPVA
ncbi:hypothetical protein HYH02_004613 [Chlamydomonas schloesseri]|uniref:Bulb-type lectin domain-containing protein n=1 Tax=Chlamydomonas schloesseri TaxID=2026947 RepID=A0A835WNM1_9CHLO|nr:hypothetical protein HYH02_004613 [Chlamydomonas schloesseri]|eukprot:KAG2450776.1 hypothetical protein HYH02_004613 [Chlamydomonas schloesseri]